MAQGIVVRNIESRLDENTDKYWYGDDPFLTHFFNAVSSTFPEGERFFIRSVRHYADSVEDAVASDTIARFVGQEGRHSREHDGHVELLVEQGYPALAWLNRNQKVVMGWINRKAPRFALAMTVAIEHVTAVFAHEFLHRPERWIGPMHPDMQAIWRWHAVEEAEHKAVAFDVYRAAGLPLWMRRLAMLDATIGFLAEIFLRHCYLLIKDRQLRPSVLWQGAKALFGKEGLLRVLAPHLKPFYRADFHPDDQDDRALLAQRCREWGLASA